jgi:hypothetical protein
MNERIPAEYQGIQIHIRRAHIERSMALGRLFGNVAEVLIRAAGRAASSVIGSFSHSRDAQSIGADALLGRTFMR